jgi:hypothetical protein
VGVGWLVDEGCAGWGWYGKLIGEGLSGGGGRVAMQGACGGRGLFSYISFVRVCLCVCICGCACVRGCVYACVLVPMSIIYLVRAWTSSFAYLLRRLLFTFTNFLLIYKILVNILVVLQDFIYLIKYKSDLIIRIHISL